MYTFCRVTAVELPEWPIDYSSSSCSPLLGTDNNNEEKKNGLSVLK